MEIFEHFLAVGAIVEESIKLLPKNWSFLALIALLFAFLYSSLSIAFNFFTISLSSDMLVKQYMSLDPSRGYGSSPTANPFQAIMKDVGLLFLVDISFFLGIFIASLFATIATVIVSAASYSSKTLSGKDLVLQVVKSWIRPLITSFYTSLLMIGYLAMVTIWIIPLMIFSKTYMLSIAVVAGVIAYIFYLYLNVVWILSLVVSVMEENNYGIQALGRAGVLTEGRKLQGFILNTSLAVLSFVLSTGFRIIVGKKLMAHVTVFWMSASIFVCLTKTLLLVAYTVLYFHCKKDHGEEMELQDSINYKKLSTEPPFSNAV